MKTNIIYENNGTTFRFIKSNTLPNIKISTPISIPFIGNDVILVYSKKRQWWDFPGGKLENKENWQDALKREIYEEASITINKIVVIGYIEAINKNRQEYRIILPVTITFVDKVLDFNPNTEISKRIIARKSKAVKLLAQRNDNNQMIQILDVAFDWLKNNIKDIKFEYQSGETPDDLPITQVMALLSNNKGEICIVRDEDENFYSLVGGSCELDETPIESMKREIIEETQINSFNLSLLGSLLVTYIFNDGHKQRFRQCRFAGTIEEEIKEYNPERRKFEVIERKFINIADLSKKVPMMSFDLSKKILEDFLEYKKQK